MAAARMSAGTAVCSLYGRWGCRAADAGLYRRSAQFRQERERIPWEGCLSDSCVFLWGRNRKGLNHGRAQTTARRAPCPSSL
eukprot:366113-Chlamydomonas_euryale.AAC.23